jgi:hypothetical protein
MFVEMDIDLDDIDNISHIEHKSSTDRHDDANFSRYIPSYEEIPIPASAYPSSDMYSHSLDSEECIGGEGSTCSGEISSSSSSAAEWQKKDVPEN